jgi:PhnB protein
MAKKSKKASKKHAKKKHVKKVVKKSAKKKATKKPAKKASKKPGAKPLPKSTTISPYLTFAGNCEEAFNYYKSVFGGQFTYMGRFKEMPPMEGQPPMSEADGEKIMHVSLPISTETFLMGSDSSEAFGQATVMGNNFSVSVNARNNTEADRLYHGLSAGGHATMPMSKTFWGSYFGMCTDKFGIQWMVSVEEAKK